MGCTRAPTGAAPPRSTSASTRSTACWSWDARSPSASPDPGRGRGRCARDPDPCNTVPTGTRGVFTLGASEDQGQLLWHLVIQKTGETFPFRTETDPTGQTWLVSQ